MKKTYMIPTVKVTALTESEPLCTSVTIDSTNSYDGSAFCAKSGNAVFDDEEDEEEY